MNFTASKDSLESQAREWLVDQVPLFEAFFVALSVHIIIIPVLWFMGLVLPWPKGPVVTTVVEFDLENWPHSVKPKKILEIRNPDLNP